MNPMTLILQRIRKVRKHIQLGRLLRHGLAWGTVGGLAGLAVLLAAIWIPLYYAQAAALLLVGLGLVSGVCYSLITRPSLEKTALAADRAGMRESLTTALEFGGCDGVLHRLQREQTVRLLGEFDIKSAFPIRLPKRECGMFALTLCVCLLLALIPTQAKADAQEQHGIQEAVREEAAKIERVLNQLEQRDPEEAAALLSDQQQEALEALLEEALSELEDARSLEELEKSLERLDKKLEIAAQQAGSRELATTTLEIARELGLSSQIRQQERQERIQQRIRELLEGENAAGLSEEELAEWAQRLSQELAQGELTQMSVAEAAQALGMSEEELREILDRIAQETAPQGQGQAGDGSGQTGQDGQGDGQSGQGAGQDGQGDGQGDGQSGQSGQGYDTGGKTGFERDPSTVKSAEELEIPGRVLGEDENLTGERVGGDSYFVETEDGLTWSGQRVDYNQVAGQYAQRAYSEINRSEIPGEMKDIVRDYFSALTD